MAAPAGATNYIEITADKTKLAASMPDAGNTFAADLVIDQAAAINYEGGAATFIDGLLAGCTDLKVTDPTGAVNVPFGVKQFSQVAGTRKLILGLGIPTGYPLSNAADTTYRLYRGCTGGTFENKAGVVPTADGFVRYIPGEAVSPNVADWTANAGHLTPAAGLGVGAAKIGSGLAPTDDLHFASGADTNSVVPFTFQCWAKAGTGWQGAPGIDGRLAGIRLRRESPGHDNFYLLLDGNTSNKNVQSGYTGGAAVSTATNYLTLGAWYLITATVDAGLTHILYVNGVVANSTVQSVAPDSSQACLLYIPHNGVAWETSLTDEMQVHSVARSGNWSLSYYNMTVANGAFWTVGAEQACPVGGIRRFNPGLWTPGTNPGVM